MTRPSTPAPTSPASTVTPRRCAPRSTGPDLGSCSPLDCRNAAFTTANRDALRDELARINAHLARPPELPPYLQHTLASRRDAITAFLAANQRMPE